MIRFCDREINCIDYASLTRRIIEDYFSDHKEDVLYVFDTPDTMRYEGAITYNSYRRAINIDSAIQREYVILGADMWQEARDYFVQKSGNKQKDIWLPVLDEEYRLLSFAYDEDKDANREIRMLRELVETPAALRFIDLYPEYQCVKIYECNELAFLFAKYLEKQNVAVEVVGTMWRNVFEGGVCQIPDYECMRLYAEGRGRRENLQTEWYFNRSVSAEFECIDKIYEENIKKGIVKDAKGTCADLLERLKGENEIIILGTGQEEQDAYDFLKQNGISVCCFVDAKYNDRCHRLFGKNILRPWKVRHVYRNPIFIDCTSQNSAWGFGEVDDYDYLGYLRNERFFFLRDYVKIPRSNLINALENMEVILAGDAGLCNYLYKYLKRKNISVKGYLAVDALMESMELQEMPKYSAEDIDKETMCLVIYPKFFGKRKLEEKYGEIMRQFDSYLIKYNFDNYTYYFSDMLPYISMEENNKYTKKYLRPKSVVLGSIDGANGTHFFRGLLDNHPNILMLQYGILNEYLFWICIRLSIVGVSDVLSLFWKIVESDKDEFADSSAFNFKMEQLLALDDKFTPQEIFVMIHIAYNYMNGRNIAEDDMQNMVIYWEPHYVEGEILEQCVEWLGTETLPCDIINVVRNICPSRGSSLKIILRDQKWGYWTYDRALNYMLSSPSIDKREYANGNRLVMKFEEIKCNPKEMSMKICCFLGIRWDDTMMVITRLGEELVVDHLDGKIRGFDLQPVYNTYEKFFSEFDRFRMVLINAPWQRKYGYPYVEVSQFTKRELAEMFSKEFRFAKLMLDQDRSIRLEIQVDIKNKLQKAYMLEVMS